MKNYINQITKEIYAYESDGSQDAYIKDGLVPISDADLAILRAPTLPEAKATKLTTLSQSYQAAIQADINYMNTVFQADNASQVILVQSLIGGSASAPPAWLNSSNVWIPMTFLELQGFAGAMITRGTAAFDKLQGLKQEARDTETGAELDLIVWA